MRSAALVPHISPSSWAGWLVAVGPPVRPSGPFVWLGVFTFPLRFYYNSFVWLATFPCFWRFGCPSRKVWSKDGPSEGGCQIVFLSIVFTYFVLCFCYLCFSFVFFTYFFYFCSFTFYFVFLVFCCSLKNSWFHENYRSIYANYFFRIIKRYVFHSIFFILQ